MSFLCLYKCQRPDIVGKKPGELFSCALLKEHGECGNEEYCMGCELNKWSLYAIEKNLPVENKIITKEFIISGEIVKKNLRISIKPILHRTKRLFVVTFDDVTQSISLQTKLQEQNEKMKRDLLLAKGIQNGLLPETGKIGHLDFHYIYRPCEALGGDFIDFYHIDNRHTGIIMADVAGHGLASSMFTIFLYSLIDRSLKSPAEILKKVFMEFSKFKVSSETYITMFSAVYNIKTKILTVANAGFNNPPYIKRSNEIEQLECVGIPISNWVSDTTYDEITTKVKRGERMIMFSDGITETVDEDGNQLGANLLLDVLSDQKLTGEQVVRKALYEARLETNTNIKDDITIAVIDF